MKDANSAPDDVMPTQDAIEVVLALFRACRYGEAELLATDIVRRKPDCAAAWKVLGYAQLAQAKPSLHTLSQAAQRLPGDAELHGNLGIAQRNAGMHDAAVASFRRALELDPASARGWHNLAAALYDSGDANGALAAYAAATERDPGLAEAWNQAGLIEMKRGEIATALECFRRAIAAKPAFLDAYTNFLFTNQYVAAHDAAEQHRMAQSFGRQATRMAQACTEWPNLPHGPHAARRLRIGLVSGDLRSHPISYFLEDLLAELAAGYTQKLEIFAYATVAQEDAETARIRRSCSAWRMVERMSDAELAQQIHADGIDILLDLSGHTGANRLPVFAWKPAPVQASWIGYVGTTGLAEMDYVIADRWTVPEGDEGGYTEAIWRMPETFVCFSRPRAALPVAPLPALQNGWITFGSFNNLNKMGGAVTALWSELLHAVPHSKLFLNSKPLIQEDVRRSVQERFARHGIAAERLILEGQTQRDAAMRAYGRVDVALDPFPYSGGTTTIEALWMGVPVLKLAGRRFSSRLGESYLRAVGLEDWIASDETDYVASARRLTSDPAPLSHLRGTLRATAAASPLFDTARFARHFEQAMRAMWQRRWSIP